MYFETTDAEIIVVDNTGSLKAAQGPTCNRVLTPSILSRSPSYYPHLKGVESKTRVANEQNCWDLDLFCLTQQFWFIHKSSTASRERMQTSVFSKRPHSLVGSLERKLCAMAFINILRVTPACRMSRRPGRGGKQYHGRILLPGHMHLKLKKIPLVGRFPFPSK